MEAQRGHVLCVRSHSWQSQGSNGDEIQSASTLTHRFAYHCSHGTNPGIPLLNRSGEASECDGMSEGEGQGALEAPKNHRIIL